jgi:copper chaperone CopZ
MTSPRYDRAAATRILARLAEPGVFRIPAQRPAPRTVRYRAHRLTPEPGSHLTLSQRLYLERFMRPCPPAHVVTATHRISWTDSDGVPCTGHYRDDGLGPIMPIAVRETNLRLWRSLQVGDDLDAGDRAVLEGTTTDHDPREIFRIGVEAAGRAVAQHALATPPAADPAWLVRAMASGGIFAAVASQWYWELQASTFRRGMIPARLMVGGDGSLRYTTSTVAILRRMKDATIADARAVMARAVGEEGRTAEAAVRHYHDDLDLISRQYALLPPGARPRCLALPGVLPAVADAYVDTFLRTLPGLEAEPDGGEIEEPDGEVFHVPDMNCRHCTRTIRAVLESMDVIVEEIDLDTKRVRAEFRSPRNRERAFAAIRDSGYTVAGPSR